MILEILLGVSFTGYIVAAFVHVYVLEERYRKSRWW